MKTLLTALVASALLLTGITPPAYAAKPMHPAVEKLDLDGDFVVFLNTDGIEERLMDLLEEIAELGAAASMNPAEIEMGLKTIENAVEWSGILSLTAFAMSSAQVDDGLTRIISVVEHDEDDADRALWRMISSEPRELKGIQYAPEDAVYIANTTLSLNETWHVLNEGVAEIGGDEAAMALNQQLMMAQILIGTNISVITESIDEDILVSIQLSEDREVEFPSEGLTIPEPSLLIGMGVNNSIVKDLLLQKIQLSGMPMTNITHGATELNVVNLPEGMAPVPLSPTIAMTDDYLLIGSTIDTVKAALDAYAEKEGAIATDDYKRLMKNAPAKVSAIEYLAPRFMETYMDVLSEAIGDEPEAEAVFSAMEEFMSELYSGAYMLNTSTGIYSETLMNCGGMRPSEFIAAYYTAIVAAVAVPLMSQNTEEAMTIEGQVGCTTIATALALYRIENPLISGEINPLMLPGITLDDLNGRYFTADSYVLQITDIQNFVIMAKGEGDAAGKMVIYKVENGVEEWITP